MAIIDSGLNKNTSMYKFALFGAGGFSRELLSTSELYGLPGSNKKEILVVDSTPKITEIYGYPVVQEEHFLNYREIAGFAVAISDVKIRKNIASQCEKSNLNSKILTSMNSIIGANVLIGEGSIVCHGSILTADIVTGKFFQMNIHSYVGHDCHIGDFVTLAPRVSINGNVVIGDNVYIGTGAIIRNGSPRNKIVVGSNSVIGMGAVVTKSIPENTVFVGNPARKLKDL